MWDTAEQQPQREPPTNSAPGSSTQTATVQRPRRSNSHDCECMTLMRQSIDTMTKNFEDETWTMALGIAATIKPLPAAQRRDLITQIDNVIADFFEMNAP